jgi:hypothetical protein
MFSKKIISKKMNKNKRINKRKTKRTKGGSNKDELELKTWNTIYFR